jgi:hypothetical protein
MVTVSDRETAFTLHVQHMALDLINDVSAAIEEAVEQGDVRREREFHVK